ncbi:hypothetical protein GCM10027343_31820 [Noviherbaspirillum agri]
MARIEQTIEVNAPVHAAYNQLTRFEQYPRFIDDVQEVRQLDDKHLHWHTKAGDLDLEWDAEITEQVPDRCIAWRTTSGPHYEGKIELKPTEQDRTQVTLTMECDTRQQLLAQHGDAEDALSQRTVHDLARFKKFIEKLVSGKGEESRAGSHTGKPASMGSGEERTTGEMIGKAIGQTASERQEAAQSAGIAQGGQRNRLQRAGQADSVGEQEGQDSSSGQRGQSDRPGQPGQPIGADLAARMPWLPGLLQAWNEPFGMMRRMTEEMDQLIHQYIGRPLNDARLRATSATSATGWTPPIEVAQRNRKFVVCAELPGVRREDVQVEVQHDRVTIEGDRRQEPMHEAGEYRRSERSYGHFYRVIALPPGADPDAASASLKDGVLEITVPVPGNTRQGRRLDIEVAG